MLNKSCLDILDFSWSLSVTFGLQLSIEVPQFSLEVSLVWSRSAGVGPLRACETGEKKYVELKLSCAKGNKKWFLLFGDKMTSGREA